MPDRGEPPVSTDFAINRIAHTFEDGFEELRRIGHVAIVTVQGIRHILVLLQPRKTGRLGSNFEGTIPTYHPHEFPNAVSAEFHRIVSSGLSQPFLVPLFVGRTGLLRWIERGRRFF